MRINARLDEDTGRKLAYLERETNMSVSEIVRQAISAYYARFRNDNADPAGALIKAGFIGCGEGPSDLSATYKDGLRTLAKKHGDR